ncbi:MAG: hypothetical protein QOH13_1142 [Thermoleophilaceae bacterium]|nr:hypothetical protein [Thermoleophilaceae bacterium]
MTLSSAGFDRHAPAEVVVLPGETVTFTNNSLLENVQFTDESSTRCQAPAATNCARTFPSAGVFRFYDSAQGCMSYDACTDPYRGIVVVDGPPSVTSLTGPAATNRGQSVAYSASASDPNGDSIATFNWDFGDGGGASTSDGAISHVYTTAGHFTVTLTVVDSRGNVSAPSQIGIDILVPDSDGDGINDDADRCVAQAGPPPDGCPLAPPPFIPDPINISTTAAQALAVTGASKSGIAVVVNCSSTCTAVLSLTPAAAAKRSATPVAALSTKTVALPTGGSRLVTLTFSSTVRKKLLKAGTSKLFLSVAITDALGRIQTRKSSITLKPVKTVGKLPAIGISDQQPTTFTDPLFQVLKVKYARLVTPWNSILTEPARLDTWLQAARAQGARPLVSFEHTRGQICPGKRCKGPSAAQYKKAWKAFHKKYSWVKDISPWNEINSATQPTGKRPDLAALYYNTVRASCRGCSIVAADLLDASNIRRYVAAFLKKAKGKPRLWGLHNYTDTNRFRSRGTNALLQTVKGTVWLTETGGVVKFVTQGGKVALPKSESRAKKAMDYMFRLAELNAKRIKRIYVYQWKINNVFDRFDAGVVRPDGTPRPSFDVLTLNASIARKH